MRRPAVSGVLQSICLKLPKCAEETQIGNALPAVTANTTGSCGDCTVEKLSPRCQGAYNTANVSSDSTSGSRGRGWREQGSSRGWFKVSHVAACLQQGLVVSYLYSRSIRVVVQGVSSPGGFKRNYRGERWEGSDWKSATGVCSCSPTPGLNQWLGGCWCCWL